MSDDINITWTVNSVKAYKNLGEYTNYVYQTYWTCAGNYSGISGIYDSSFAGATPIGTGIVNDPTYSFKPFNELTQDDVLTWIWDSLLSSQGKSYYEDKVTNEILYKMNFVSEDPTLPWNPAPSGTPIA